MWKTTAPIPSCQKRSHRNLQIPPHPKGKPPRKRRPHAPNRRRKRAYRNLQNAPRTGSKHSCIQRPTGGGAAEKAPTFPGNLNRVAIQKSKSHKPQKSKIQKPLEILHTGTRLRARANNSGLSPVLISFKDKVANHKFDLPTSEQPHHRNLAPLADRQDDCQNPLREAGVVHGPDQNEHGDPGLPRPRQAPPPVNQQNQQNQTWTSNSKPHPTA